MSNLRENYLMNGKFSSSSFVSRHHQMSSNDLDEPSNPMGRLSKSSRMLNTNSHFEKSSLKNVKPNRDRKVLLDKPSSCRKLKSSDCLLSKSAHNLNTHSANHLSDNHHQFTNDNCPNNRLNGLNHPSDNHHQFTNDNCPNNRLNGLNHQSNNNVSINSLVSRLLQMEKNFEMQSAKLFNFEKKIEDLNRENDELTQTLLANRMNLRDAGCDSKSCNPFVNLKDELSTVKERLNSQIVLNNRLEKENGKLADKYQQVQTKLVESEEKYETLMGMKNRELDEHKLKIEQLLIEINRKEEEYNQLELDKQHLCNKISILNQVTDKQDDKIEEHKNQLKQIELEIENLRKQVDGKEMENEKIRKELILTKNSLKKVQNLNHTNESLILWLNKQLTDSQAKYNLLYPKPKKSTSINLNQRVVDCESNLSEALSDSHLFGHANRCANLDVYPNDYCRNEFVRSDFKNELTNEYKNEDVYKNEYKSDCNRLSSRQMSGNCAANNLRSAELNRRLECQDYSIINRTELKSNYLPAAACTQINE